MQKVLQNSAGKPSDPGDLVDSIDCNAFRLSSIFNKPSQLGLFVSPSLVTFTSGKNFASPSLAIPAFDVFFLVKSL